jgi:heme exporter protein CcmD
MAQFFDMGVYTNYIWSAYLLTALVMILLVVVTWLDVVKQRRLLQSLESEGARPRAPARDIGSST